MLSIGDARQLVTDVLSLVTVGKKIEIAEVKLKVQELLLGIGEREDRIRELEAELKGLHEKLAFKGKLTFKAPFYFADEDPVPYCQMCWESDREAMHLFDVDGENYTCQKCGKTFWKREIFPLGPLRRPKPRGLR